MIAEQKNLLKDVRAIEADARKLYDAGVKIPGVVQKLREAAGELDARVRFIERAAKPKAAPVKAPAPSVPAPEKTPAAKKPALAKPGEPDKPQTANS